MNTYIIITDGSDIPSIYKCPEHLVEDLKYFHNESRNWDKLPKEKDSALKEFFELELEKVDTSVPLLGFFICVAKGF